MFWCTFFLWVTYFSIATTLGLEGVLVHFFPVGNIFQYSNHFGTGRCLVHFFPVGNIFQYSNHFGTGSTFFLWVSKEGIRILHSNMVSSLYCVLQYMFCLLSPHNYNKIHVSVIIMKFIL